MANARITIVGLGLIGNSIGLALRVGQRTFEVVGHDKDSKAAGEAKRIGAVDKTDWNLINACDGADLVVLALPALAIRDTLEVLASELKPNCVILDTASIKAPVLRWAEELLPDTVHFVGTNPIVSADESGGGAARVDLFHQATWAICTNPETNPSAVRTASDLVERLGGQPMFLDALEHDGMLAAVEHLPAVVSTALLASLTGQPAWREMRRLAGGQLENTTRLTSADPRVFSDTALANRENLTRWIDVFIDTLRDWRSLIEDGDEEDLQKRFAQAVEERNAWARGRRSGQLEEIAPRMPERRSMLTDLLGFGRRRSQRDGDRDR